MDITPILTEFLTSEKSDHNALVDMIDRLGAFSVLFDTLFSTPLLSYTDSQLNNLAQFMSSHTIEDEDDLVPDFDEINQDLDDIDEALPNRNDTGQLDADQVEKFINSIKADQLAFQEVLLKVCEKVFRSDLGKKLFFQHHGYLLLFNGVNTFYRQLSTKGHDGQTQLPTASETPINIARFLAPSFATSITSLPLNHPTTQLFLATFFNTLIETTNTPAQSADSQPQFHPLTISHNSTFHFVTTIVLKELETTLKQNIAVLLSSTTSLQDKTQQLTFLDNSLQNTLITLLQAIGIDVEQITSLLALYSFYRISLNYLFQQSRSELNQLVQSYLQFKQQDITQNTQSSSETAQLPPQSLLPFPTDPFLCSNVQWLIDNPIGEDVFQCTIFDIDFNSDFLSLYINMDELKQSSRDKIESVKKQSRASEIAMETEYNEKYLQGPQLPMNDVDQKDDQVVVEKKSKKQLNYGMDDNAIDLTGEDVDFNKVPLFLVQLNPMNNTDAASMQPAHTDAMDTTDVKRSAQGTSYQAIVQKCTDFSTIFTRVMAVLFKLIDTCGNYHELAEKQTMSQTTTRIDQTLLSKITFYTFSSLNSLEIINKLKSILIFPQLSTLTPPNCSHPLSHPLFSSDNNKQHPISPQLPDLVLSLSILDLLIPTLTATKLGLYYLLSTGFISDLIFAIFSNMKVLTPITHKPTSTLHKSLIPHTTLRTDFKQPDAQNASLLLHNFHTTSKGDSGVDIYSLFPTYFETQTNEFYDEEDQNLLQQTWYFSSPSIFSNSAMTHHYVVNSSAGSDPRDGSGQNQHEYGAQHHQQNSAILSKKPSNLLVESKLSQKQFDLWFQGIVNEFMVYVNTFFKFLSFLFEKCHDAAIDLHLFLYSPLYLHQYLKEYHLDQGAMGLAETAYGKAFTTSHYHLLSLCFDSFFGNIDAEGFDPRSIVGQLVQYTTITTPQTTERSTPAQPPPPASIKLVHSLVQKTTPVAQVLFAEQLKSHTYPSFLLPFVFVRGLTVALRFQSLFSAVSMLVAQYTRQHFIEALYPTAILGQQLWSLIKFNKWDKPVQIEEIRLRSNEAEFQLDFATPLDELAPSNKIDAILLNFSPYYSNLTTYLLTLSSATPSPTTRMVKGGQTAAKQAYSYNPLAWSPYSSLLAQYFNYDDSIGADVLHRVGIALSPRNLTSAEFLSPSSMNIANWVLSRHTVHPADLINGSDNELAQQYPILLKPLGFPSNPLQKYNIATSPLPSTNTSVSTSPLPPLHPDFLHTFHIISFLQAISLTFLAHSDRLSPASFASIAPLVSTSQEHNATSSTLFSLPQDLAQLNAIQWGMFCHCGYSHHFSALPRQLSRYVDEDGPNSTDVSLPNQTETQPVSTSTSTSTSTSISPNHTKHINLYSKTSLSSILSQSHQSSTTNKLLRTLGTTLPLFLSMLVDETQSVIEERQFASFYLLKVLSSPLNYTTTLSNLITSTATSHLQRNNSLQHKTTAVSLISTSPFLPALLGHSPLLSRLIDEDHCSSQETTKLLYDWKHQIAQLLVFGQRSTFLSSTQQPHPFYHHLTCTTVYHASDSNWDELCWDGNDDDGKDTKEPSSHDSSSSKMDDGVQSNRPSVHSDDDDDDDGYGGYYSKRYRNELGAGHDIDPTQSTQSRANPNNPSQQVQPTVQLCSFYPLTTKRHLEFDHTVKQLEIFARTMHMLPPKQNTNVSADVAQ